MTPPEISKITPVVISTALGHDGRGIFPYTLLPGYRRLIRTVQQTGTTVLGKSATRFKRIGNFIPSNPLTWRYIRRLPDKGMLNAYGLTNPGVAAWAPDLKEAARQGFRVIPNFYPEFAQGGEIAVQETLEAVDLYRRILGPYFWALELNFSCPNSAEEIRKNVQQGINCTHALRQRFPELFLIAKISICHPYEFAQELEGLGVAALHAINTIPYDLLFPGQRSPLQAVGGGGVSGGPALAAAFDYNRGLRQKVSLFLIMGCGVRNRADVEKYFDLGANAVSFCTLALRDFKEAEKIILTYRQ
jgi:dihydroorotate dehydrogenase